MSPALRNLLVATGVVVGSFGVYLAAPGTDPEAVKTAALADGFVARAAEAEFRVLPAGISWLADAGIIATKYVRLQFPVGLGVGKEADGGDVVILPDLPFDKLDRAEQRAVSVTTCAARPGVCPRYGDARPFVVVTHACAWKPSLVAVCAKLNPDGGADLDPGVENTMQPAEWVGSGCVRKSCTEVAGESSAP